jgi:hypothetical protein
VFVDGNSPWWNLAVYSKYLMIMNTSPHRIVIPRYRRNFLKSFRTSDAHASTIVIEDVIRLTVLTAASGMFRYCAPCGQLSAPTRSMM